jgi:HEPN domain-containing protein
MTPVSAELRAKVRELDQERRIDPVAGNQGPVVEQWLDQAGRHLDSADKLAAEDPTMALEAIHQACRKSLVGHLAAGWRPAGPNKHALMTDYGVVALAPFFTADELLGLDIIRRFRNSTDYDDPNRVLAVEQLERLIALARRYHQTIERGGGKRRRPPAGPTRCAVG